MQTTPTPSPAAQPLTLSDWRAAYAAGVSPAHLLGALQVRLVGARSAHAWIALVDAQALADSVANLEARAATYPDRAAALRAMPLFGVPFAAKDNIDVVGFPTTAACPAFAHEVTASATVIEHLQQAGAVCMGKTNLDQFATGLVGTRSPYGRPSSAFSADHISGGSSSGSAVVVAAGEVCFALGTDTAGSGRVPAGFNNIVGMKPTPGRVSNAGVLPACRTLDCIAVLALTVSDAAQVMAVIEGSDPLDAYSSFQTGPSHLSANLSAKLRIGVPMKPVFGSAQGTDPLGYAAAFAQAMAQAQAMGHTVVVLDFEPLHSVANLLYSGPWVAERHTVVQTLMDSNPSALDPTVARVIGRATSFTATDTFRAQYLLRAAQRDTALLWQQVDVLMVPTAPTHPTHAQVDADPVSVNAHMGTYTNFVNLLGWCALALPAGFVSGIAQQRLPFGVTFIAPGAADAALARFGLNWEESLALPLGATGRTASPTPQSASWPASQPSMSIAVVGAHLSGMPLNKQLTDRGARLLEATHTAARYQLFALPNTTPPKPGLQRAAADQPGASIAVEVWDVPMQSVGSFLALIPPPLGLGSVELSDGRWVHGFICEAHALADATEVTAFGGWRAYVQSLK